MQNWTEADFDALCFHDVRVHGIAIEECEHGAGRLKFDMDYILEWLCDTNGSQCKFRVAPADLVFRDVYELKISIDYATPQACTSPFAIDGIRRTLRSERGFSTFQWTIPVNWPSGQISFESPGFNLSMRGSELITESQYLTIAERTKR